MSTLPGRFVRAAAALAVVCSLPGCGYSLAGRGSFLPASIKIVGVPMFVNNTSVYDVEKRITEKVISEFIGRGKYKVEPSTTGVDAVLLGEISSITLAPTAFTEERLASRYVLTVTARIEFKDVKADKVLWSNPSLQFREEYDVTNSVSATDATAFFGQNVNALDRLATEFARSVVSAILEAF
jgi:lipopolysaccharide assembly LptE-like protein